MYLLLLALYVGLIAGALILMLSDLAAGWIFVGFTVISMAGFIFQRARIIAASFLLASLALLIAGLLGMSHSEKEWVTITVGGCMAALSAFSLYWAAFRFKPGPEPAFVEEDEAGTTKALKCPSCGSPDVEGDYPEFRCPYCGTRFGLADE
jgi:DNA-directed RNA polymerase subunit RPC12/RpoP